MVLKNQTMLVLAMQGKGAFEILPRGVLFRKKRETWKDAMGAKRNVNNSRLNHKQKSYSFACLKQTQICLYFTIGTFIWIIYTLDTLCRLALNRV